MALWVGVCGWRETNSYWLVITHGSYWRPYAFIEHNIILQLKGEKNDARLHAFICCRAGHIDHSARKNLLHTNRHTNTPHILDFTQRKRMKIWRYAALSASDVYSKCLRSTWKTNDCDKYWWSLLINVPRFLLAQHTWCYNCLLFARDSQTQDAFGCLSFIQFVYPFVVKSSHSQYYGSDTHNSAEFQNWTFCASISSEIDMWFFACPVRYGD